MALKGNNICNNKDLQLQGFLTDSENHPSVSINTQPLLDDYHVETKPFARGKFATVRRCTDKTNDRTYAAKCIKKRRRSANVRHEIMHEILVLKMCEPCPRIIHLHQIYEGPSEIILVLEMAEGGELQRLLDDDEMFEESQVIHVIIQVLEALSFLHGLNIVHLDIKPQNILLTGSFPQCDIKLCDFGISRLVSEGIEVREIVGTPDYVAPEILQYEPISFASDMWSIGVLTYVLLSGYTPFGGATKQETFCNITKGTLEFPEKMFQEVSNHAKDFIQKLLVQNQRQRMLPENCLKHPWIAPNSEEISRQNLSSKTEKIEFKSTPDENRNYMVNSYTQNKGDLLQQNYFEIEVLPPENVVRKTSAEQQQQTPYEVINVEEETEQKEESSNITECKQQVSIIPPETVIDQPFLKDIISLPRYQPPVVPAGKMEENQLLQKNIFLPEHGELVEKKLSPKDVNVLHNFKHEGAVLSLDTVEEHLSPYERKLLQKHEPSALPVEAVEEKTLVQNKNKLPKGSSLPGEIMKKQEENILCKHRVSLPPMETKENKPLLNDGRILTEPKVSTLSVGTEDGQKLFEDMLPRRKVSVLPVETVDDQSLPRHKVSVLPVETVDDQSLPRHKVSVLPVEIVDDQSLPRHKVSVLPVETVDDQSLPRHKVSVLPVETVVNQSLPRHKVSALPVETADDQSLPKQNVSVLPVETVDDQSLPRHKVSVFPVETVDDQSLTRHKVSVLLVETVDDQSLPGHKVSVLPVETVDDQSLTGHKVSVLPVETVDDQSLTGHKVSVLPVEIVDDHSLLHKEMVLPRHKVPLLLGETVDDLSLFHKEKLLRRHKLSLLSEQTLDDQSLLHRKKMIPRYKVSGLPEEGVDEQSLFYKEKVLPKHNRSLFPVETEDDLSLFHNEKISPRQKVSLFPVETPEDLPLLQKTSILFPNLRHHELPEEIPVTQNNTFLSHWHEKLLKDLPTIRPLVEEYHRNFQKSAKKLLEMPSLFEDYVHFSSFESTSQGARTIYMRDETVLCCNKPNLNNKLMINDEAFLKNKMHNMLF